MTETYVSLLRGINVGGNKIIKMADLRSLYETLGFSGVQTLLQSGNVVFSAPAADPSALAATIEAGIRERFGFHADLYVLSAADFHRLYAANPFASEADRDGAKLLVFFLRAALPEELLTGLHAANTGPEIIRAAGRALYIYFPEGQGRSKLGATPAFTKIPGTGRNWNTVTKILQMIST